MSAGAGGGAAGSAGAGAGGTASSGTGGASGAAGASGTGGGASGMGGAGGGSGSEACMAVDTGVEVASLTSCESDTCQNAHCMPTNLLTSAQATQLADCDAQNKCVPDLLIETGGHFLLPTCRSLGDAEGRCISTCVPKVADRIDVLPQDTCADGERCAPCFDPITGEDTGSCGQSCDTGPAEDPVTFADCCGGQSACVPDAIVSEEQRAMLDATGCQEGELCAPKDIASGAYSPETCTSWGGGEGRCLPECLPAVSTRIDQLSQDVCAAGRMCVPCFDPLTGESTGACAIEGDAPTAATPYAFPTCCDDGMGNDLGTCVPGALVPTDQQSMLGADTCTDAGFMCAPTELAAGTYAPQTCRSWRNAEGRCLAACLPDIAAQSDKIDRDVCDQGELCSPCYDPTTGTATGACAIEGDMPTEPAVTFPSCCQTNSVMRGTCVPKQAAGAQGDSLPVLNCETQTNDADAYVCAPKEKVANPDFDFPSCTTQCTGSSLVCAFGGIGGKPGVCVPSCFLSEQDTGYGTADTLYGRSTCATGEDCAPCTDPQDDTPTGLCN